MGEDLLSEDLHSPREEGGGPAPAGRPEGGGDKSPKAPRSSRLYL